MIGRARIIVLLKLFRGILNAQWYVFRAYSIYLPLTAVQDRRHITLNDLHEPPPPTDLTQRPAREEEEDEDLRQGSSAKIDQLVHLLQLTPATEKSLVFSQFTSFLDKVKQYPYFCPIF